MNPLDTVYQAVLALPEDARRELLARLARDLQTRGIAGETKPSLEGVIGLWEDDAALVDALVSDVMREREQRDSRRASGEGPTGYR